MLAFVTSLLFAHEAEAGSRQSAFRPEHKMGDLYWAAGSAFDNDPVTAWMVPGESNNAGEWIEIDLPQGEVDKLGMMPGWAKSDDTWKDYPRIKKVKIDIYELDDERNEKQVGTTTAEFQDKKEWQVIDLDNIKIGSGMFGGRARITVEEIYKGEDFPNFGISELLVYMKEIKAVPTITAVSGEAATHGKDNLKDGNAKTYWAADASGAQVTFEASGYGLTRVGLVPGPAGYAKPKKVQVTVGGQSKTVELANAPGTQWVEFPATLGYTGSAWGTVTLEFLEVYPGTKGEIAIGELDVAASSYEGI